MFDRSKAVFYAKKWALNRNPNYYNFNDLGGDCTNFISQCLFAGGIKFSYENFGWFYYSLSSRAPSWTGVDEFYNFAITNKGQSGPKLVLTAISEMELGDIIQLKVKDKWTHTLIITKFYTPKHLHNIYVCAHSRDFLNKSLSSYSYNDIRFLKVIN